MSDEVESAVTVQPDAVGACRSSQVSVVVPVYRSVQSLRPLVMRIESALSDLEYEVILVDDGSSDETWNEVRDIVGQFPRTVGVRLSRNFGQHAALIAGVRAARYPSVITLDDDLQNPPEEIPHLLEVLVRDNADVVYGVPVEVRQSISRRFASRLLRRMLFSGLGVTAATDISSFRAFRTDLRAGFEGELGPSVSLDAVLSWSAKDYRSIAVEHFPREHGSSQYSVRRLARFAVDTMTGYSIIPLQFASLLGIVTALFGVGILGYVVLRPIITGETLPGFPFLASIVTIFAGVQLLTLGVFGEYLARMHFRVMRKPTYVVRDVAHSHDRPCGDASGENQ